MQQIIFPLQQPDRGPEVRNLHEVILSLSGKITIPALQSLFKDADFRETFGRERREEQFGQATMQVIWVFQEMTMGVMPSGIVDEATANAINGLLQPAAAASKPWLVQGTVYDAWLNPLADASVMVFDVNLRSEQLLGETNTDATGSYSILFTQDKFAKTGKTAPDVVVRLYGQDGNLIQSSDVVYNAPQVMQIDLSLSGLTYTGPSEFDNLVAQITPLIGQVTIDQLSETDKVHDLTYLGGKITLSLDSLIRLVMAYRYAKWTQVTAQAYYGILRQNIPEGSFSDPDQIADLATTFEPSIIQVYNALWGIGLDVLMSALQSSITTNIVAYALGQQLTSIQAQLQQLILSPSTAPGQTGPVSTVYQKISLTGLSAQQQQAFLTLNPDAGQGSDFWTSVSQDPAFQGSAAVVDKLQAVFQLSDLAGDNMALVTAVVQKNNITGMATLSTQAGLDASGWENFITANGLQSSIPADTTLPDYSAALANIFEQVFPMQAFTAKLGKAANAGPVTGGSAGAATTTGIPGAAAFAAFLTANTGFDFSNTHVNLFLGQQGVTIPPGTDQATLSAQLMAVQRVYKLAPAYEGVASLVQDGILSARQIYGMGKANFTTTYTGKLGQYQAEDVYAQAALQHGGALTMLGQLSGMVQTPTMNALPDFKTMLKNSKLTQAYPTLNSLFGVSDYCECQDCQSFLSQSAYLTDILEFLNQRISNYPAPPASPQYKVREILLANGTYPSGLPTRRSDLGDIDLSCPNINVELPYIDLVNELLEDYIAAPIFIIPKGLVTPADIKAGPITPALLAAILEVPNPGHLAPYNTAIYNILLLTANAVVSEPFYTVESAYEQWVIRDTYITLNISRVLIDADPNGPEGGRVTEIVVRELHETHLTTDQIDANPEYVNTNVYDLLRLPTAPFYPNSIPFGLPFDLFFTQANSYLDKMGIHAYELMETFSKENETIVIIDEDRFYTACAYLNLCRSEAGLVFSANIYDTDQQPLWGALIWGQANTAAGVEVFDFLQYTGLDFSQLSALLALESINGPGPTTADSSVVVFPDGSDTCDTRKMRITNLLKDSYLSTSTNLVAVPPTEKTITRLDAINRFLRLWAKTGLSMQELDACLNAPSIANGRLDENAAIQLVYFLQTMNKLGLPALQLLSFYQDIDTSTVTCLYNQLFQNLAISNPLVSQLAITSLTGTTEIDDATNAPVVLPVIMAACNLPADGLAFLLANIKTANAGKAPLNLRNLSYIYRYALLANQLSLSVQDSITLIGLMGLTPVLLLSLGQKATPWSTALFLQQFATLQTAGFSVDDLNYALTNQSTAAPSLVPDTPTITAGLTAIRSALQAVATATAVVPDPKGALLSQWLADPVLNWDKGIAALLLDILGTADDGDYTTKIATNSRFLQLLCPQYVPAAVPVYLESLPSLEFPDSTIAGISYDATTYNLGYTGVMSSATKTYLLGLNTSDINYTTAVDALFTSSQTQPISTAPLAVLPAGVSLPDRNVPFLSWFKGTLAFKGPMSGPVYSALLGQSNDHGYAYALNQLFIYSQDFAAGATVSVPLAALPVPAFPDAGLSGISYDANDLCLSFKGQMTAADYQYLLTLNTSDAGYNAVIQFLYNNSQSFPVSATVLSALPPGVTLPDPNVKALSCFKGALLFSGAMSLADYQALAALSADSNYRQALQSLFVTSLPGNQTAAPLPALPAGLVFPDNTPASLLYSDGQLSYTGQMSPADLTALLGVNPDPIYQAAINALYTSSQLNPQTNTVAAVLAPMHFPDAGIATIGYTPALITCVGKMAATDYNNLLQVNTDPVQVSIINFIEASAPGTAACYLTSLPPVNFPASISGLSYVNEILSITGPMTAAEQTTLLALSTDPGYQSSIQSLYQNSQLNPAATVNTIQLPVLPFISLPSAISGLVYSNNILSMAGAMSAAEQAALLALSAYPDYVTAIDALYTNSNLAAAPATISFVYPLQLLPLDLSLLSASSTFTCTGGGLTYSPAPLSAANFQGLLGLSDDAGYQAAIRSVYLAALAAAPGATVASAPFALTALVFPGLYSGQLSYDIASQSLSFAGCMATEDRTALLSFSPDGYYQAAINALYSGMTAQEQLSGIDDTPFPANMVANLLSLTSGTSPDTLIPNRYAWFLTAIQPYYTPLKRSVALQQQLSSLFSFTGAIARQILAYTDDNVYATLAADDFVNAAKNINTACYPAQFYCYVYLARLAFFTGKFNISAADIAWLLPNSQTIGAIHFLDVPGNWVASGGTDNPNETFSAWQNLNDCYVFAQKYPSVTVPDPQDSGQSLALSVFAILQQVIAIQSGLYPAIPGTPIVVPDPGAFLSGLVALTGWDQADLGFLLNLPHTAVPVNPLNLLIDNPVTGSIVSISNTGNLLRLQQCILLAARLGVKVSRCVSWGMPKLSVTAILSGDIKQALKAQYPANAQWESAIVPLQNTLREKRRDAMLAYVLANPRGADVFTDEYDVYCKFLIDLEMDSCQPTTRVVQGYCSVQLFVQRCLMNLEPNVRVVTESTDGTSFDENWNQWQWMRTYESWRKNRLVYLYPENYIQPELLPNQSVFFQNMQNDLTQNEVNKELADTVFMNYLTSLDGVARLQVQGQWFDDDSNTLHVFGGTYGGSPTTYYYRRWSSNRVWSPWEQVSLDIPDGHLVPVVMSGRVFLFWPVFTSTSDEDTNSQTVPPPVGSGGSYPQQDPPDKYWSIQMAYSEYQNGTWSPKRISANSIETMNITYDKYKNAYPGKSDFVFIAWDVPGINSKESVLTNLKNSAGTGSVEIACYYTHGTDFGSELYLSSFYFEDRTKIFVKGSYLDIVGLSAVIKTFNFQFADALDSKTSNGLAEDDKTVASVTLHSKNQILQNQVVHVYPPHAPSNNYHVTQTNDNLILLVDSTADNAFRLDICRGFPVTTVLDNPHHVSGSNFFDHSYLTAMLDHGKTPLSAPHQAKILNPPNTATYNNAIALQMGLFDKYLYILNKGKKYTLGTLLPFIYQDGNRTYFVAQEITTKVENFYPDCKKALLDDPNGSLGKSVKKHVKKFNGVAGPQYHFYNFFHPYACSFFKTYFNRGLDALMQRSVQLTGDKFIGTGDNGFDFDSVYKPNGNVYGGTPVHYWNGKTDNKPAYPKEDVDFALDSGYGLYNMELFYYGVLMTAMGLSQNRQFETADHFFKYIFNPGDTSSYQTPQKYWVTKPFFAFSADSTTMDELITQLDLGTAPSGFVQSVTAMREDPFDPFAIARARTLPFMITTVMRYLDNLIAWGDSLFTQHTMESVNQALQIYLLAWELLGTKPEAIPDPEEVPVCNYYQLETSLASAISNNNPDSQNPWPSLSDPLVQVENMVPVMKAPPGSYSSAFPLPSLPSLLYFCIPPNQQLLQYWNTVADRLYKIRHCENIEGQFDPLSPFPGGQGANGQDADNMNDLNGMQLYYRFAVMIQKTGGLCNEVKSLGSGLLSALEKKDAEAMSLLRSGQEITVQKAVMQVKQLQVTDAQYALDNLNNYQALVQTKIDYYQGLINGGLNTGETAALVLNTASSVIDDAIVLGYTLAGGLYLIPDFIAGVAGFGGTAAAQLSEGGTNSGNSSDKAVQMLAAIATGLDKTAAIAATTAGYARRSDEWQYQLSLATNEMAQVKSQISGATTRLAIANQEVQNQQLLINNANDINSFLLNKYTNEQLYSWMITQLSNVYFSGYQLAYTMAKRAEVCWQFELGLASSSYIHYGYWNSLKSGLLSGEQLMNDLNQMEMDYLRLNAREFELTKNISMAQFDPLALLQLKTTGECFINLPEELFDMDYPGHYFRRIKTISITIPCVAGPYTTVSCTLTITTNSIRISNDASGKYPRKTTASGQPANDSRFGDNAGITASIATSSGLNDSGLFQLNFNDERYLPFEFSGAISSWYIQLPRQLMQFDYNTISDLIIQMKYTSRDGGAGLQAAAQANLQTRLTASLTTPGLGLFRVFSARRDFPTQWYAFLNNPGAGGIQELALDITERFPYFVRNPGMTIVINQVAILADSPLSTINLGLEDPAAKVVTAALSQANDPNGQFGSLLYASQVFGMSKPGPGLWEITYSASNNASNPPLLSNSSINDLIVVFYYNLQKSSS